MPAKPIWSEGVLLSQQHFQQQDLYHENLLQERLQAVTRYDWGVTILELDQVALQSGQLRISRLAAIWPDGTSIDCGDGLDVPAPQQRDFDELLVANRSNLEVYVGLAIHSDAEAAVASPDQSDPPQRYLSVHREVLDLTTGKTRQEVEQASPNLRIFFGDERRDGYTTLQIALLGRQSNGQPILLDNYVPPVLHLRASPFLSDGLNRVLTSIGTRQRELAQERNQATEGSVEFHSTDARKFWLLHTLNSSIPAINHLLHTDRCHPEDAYLALVRLAGQLCTFAAAGDPMDLPKFNYLALGETFEPLFARVKSMLPGGVERPFLEVALERREDGTFLGRLPPESLDGSEFFVAVQSALDPTVVRGSFPKLLCVASWKDIPEVARRRIRGVETEFEWSPSSALPRKPGVSFFRMRRDGDYWRGIEKTRSIAMHVPTDSDWQTASVSLYSVSANHLR